MIRRIAVIAVLAVAPLLVAAQQPEIALVMKTMTPVEFDGARKCPVCGLNLPGAVVEGSNSPDVLDKAIAAKLPTLSGCRFVFADAGKDRLDLSLPEERKALIDIAHSRGADYVLYPVLMRYRERKGSTYAVDKPAAVVFHVHLLGGDDLSDKWSGKYSEEQEALLSNLLKAKKAAKRGLKWVTADRLIADGVDAVFKDFDICGGQDR